MKKARRIGAVISLAGLALAACGDDGGGGQAGAGGGAGRGGSAMAGRGGSAMAGRGGGGAAGGISGAGGGAGAGGSAAGAAGAVAGTGGGAAGTGGGAAGTAGGGAAGTGGGAAGTGGGAAGTGGGAAGTGGGAAGTGGGAAGAGGGAAGAGGGTPDGGDPDAGPNPDGGPQTMLGTTGGTASDPGGGIRIDVPAGALAGATWFSFTPLPALANLPAGHALVDGSAWRIDWTGAGFASATLVSVRIRGTTATFAPLPAGTPETLATPGNTTAVQTCSGGNTTTLYYDDSPSGEYGGRTVIACETGNGGSVASGPGSAAVGSTTYTAPAAPTFPTIVTQPLDVTVPAGQPGIFIVYAAGTAPLTYQWRQNGNIVTSQTNNSFVVFAAQPQDDGTTVSVRVSNASGHAVSRTAKLTLAGCTDLVRDGDESDVDCGGSCPACADGLACRIAADCASRVCDANMACAVPTCTDGAANGGESGIDCGGTSSCGLCGLGFGCGGDADCADGARCYQGQAGKICSLVFCGNCEVADPAGMMCVAAADGTDPNAACPLTGSGCYGNACGCASGLSLCSPNGCTDVTRDRDNCSQCGMTCGWSCAASACAEAAAVSATGGEGTDGLGYVCVLQQNGRVYCWGYLFGGNGAGLAAYDKPTPVMGLTDVVELRAANTHACARRQSGQVVCWGRNSSNQLGDGTAIDRLTPVPVMGLTDAVEVSTGGNHSCARRASGQVVCWGDNLWGQLGDGTKTDRAVPVAVSGLTDAVEVSVSGFSTCARKQSGQVVCWGWNSFGRLGDGTTTDRPTPTPVMGITDAVEIGNSNWGACARRSTGGVVCWGQNPGGQIGNGTTGLQQLTPVAVSNLTDAVQLAVGVAASCARRQTGQVVCWGANSHYNIGDGTNTTRTTPTMVVGLTDAVEISGHNSFGPVCARRAQGEIVCWGGGPASSSTPTRTPAP
jgi:hypothetical protein